MQSCVILQLFPPRFPLSAPFPLPQLPNPTRIRMPRHTPHSYAEATVLLTIVALCTYVACLCIVHFENILRNIAKVVYARNSEDSQVQVQLVGAVCRSLRRRVLVTISVVFVTFLVRAVFSMMLATNATAGAFDSVPLDDGGRDCDCGCSCGGCGGDDDDIDYDHLKKLFLTPLAVTAAGQRNCGLCTAGCHETSHYIYAW